MEKPSRSIIHRWAAAGGAAAGALPVGADAIALAAQEVLMTIRIASLFGVELSESAAEGVIAATVGHAVGAAIFVACNVGYPFTIPVKIGIAVGVIETLGNAVFDYYEKQKFG